MDLAVVSPCPLHQRSVWERCKAAEKSWHYHKGRRGVQRLGCRGDLGWLVASPALWWQLQGRRLQGERKDTWRSSVLVAQMEKERGSREREEDAPEDALNVSSSIS